MIEAHLYVPSKDGTWKCLDGSKVISFDQVNDVFPQVTSSKFRTTVIVQTALMNLVHFQKGVTI